MLFLVVALVIVSISKNKHLDRLLNTGVQVVERLPNNQLKLILAKGIGFATGSTTEVSIYPTLDSTVKVLQQYTNTSIVINGYTDSVGSDESNQVLSEKRADSIRSYFIGKGLAANRAVSRGYGERHPICTNDTAEGRKCNRRVEITILSPQQ